MSRSEEQHLLLRGCMGVHAWTHTKNTGDSSAPSICSSSLFWTISCLISKFTFEPLAGQDATIRAFATGCSPALTKSTNGAGLTAHAPAPSDSSKEIGSGSPTPTSLNGGTTATTAAQNGRTTTAASTASGQALPGSGIHAASISALPYESDKGVGTTPSASANDTSLKTPRRDDQPGTKSEDPECGLEAWLAAAAHRKMPVIAEEGPGMACIAQSRGGHCAAVHALVECAGFVCSAGGDAVIHIWHPRTLEHSRSETRALQLESIWIVEYCMGWSSMFQVCIILRIS